MLAKKSLGQNFLTSTRAIEKIIEAADLKADDVVLEVGPGKGVLTEKLLEKAGKVIAVEKDDQLIPFLKAKFIHEITSGKFELIHGDILDSTDYQLPTTNYKLVANIPYYITGIFLRKFLSEKNQPSMMVLMLQREVAQRIIARDGKESILSISVKAYGTPRYVETVKAGSFVPAPKVDSAIIAIENISKDFFQSISEDNFFEILKAGFGSKRKFLKNNLKAIAEKSGKNLTLKHFEGQNVRATKSEGFGLAEIFAALNLPPKSRAEDLTLENWRQITALL